MATIDPSAFSEQLEQLKAQLLNNPGLDQYIRAICEGNASGGSENAGLSRHLNETVDYSSQVSDFITKQVLPPGFGQVNRRQQPAVDPRKSGPGFAARQAYFDAEATSVPEYVPEHVNGMFEANAQEEYAPSFESSKDVVGQGQEQGFKRHRGDEQILWPGWPGENVFRLIVPVQKVGGIIGRKGEFVKKINDETKARIKILDGLPGATERIVMVSAKEEPDAKLSPAMDAFLKVHGRIDAETDVMITGSASSRLLVAATQAGSLIGRQGATIKSIQDATGAMVRVLPSEDLPAYALQDDRVVEIHGDPRKVHHAIELVISHLRKFLVDRSVLPLFEHNRSMTAEAQTAPVSPNGNAVQHEVCDKQVSPPAVTSAPSAATTTEITHYMQIPLSYADAIIGTSGANISYMRRNSGATITVQETPSVPGEMTVEMQGTAAQVQAAQLMMEAFVAQYASYYTAGGSNTEYDGFAAGFGY